MSAEWGCRKHRAHSGGGFHVLYYDTHSTMLKWDKVPCLLSLPGPAFESLLVVNAPTLAVEFDKSLLILY